MDTYLKIGKYKLDLDQSEAVPITRAIADVMKPNERKKSQSKTFNLVGSQNNMKFFQSAYSLTWRVIEGNPIGFNYDIRELYNAEYFLNGKRQFDGAMQLLNVSIKDGVYLFEVVLFSEVVGIFQQWNDLQVSELGWSEYDHTLNETNIVNSFETSVMVDGVATSNFNGGGEPDGFGYLYGLVDYGFSNVADKFKQNELLPQIFYREIVVKAFAKLGYTVDESFIGSNRFKRLMLGYNGGDKFQLTALQLAGLLYNLVGDGSFSKTSNATQSNLIPTQGNFFFGSDFYFQTGNPDYSLVIGSDPSGQATTGKVTIPLTGKYRISIAFDLEYNISTTGTGPVDVENTFRLIVYVNGQGQNIDVQQFDGTASGAIYSVDYSFDLDLQSGDEYYFRFNTVHSGTIDSAGFLNFGSMLFDGDFNNSIEISQTCISSEIRTGSTVYLAAAIPPITVVAFMKGITEHFGLNISEPDANKVVYIEPRSEFYEDNETFDIWTKQINFEEPIEIEPIAISQPKTFKWKFATDSDYYRSVYNELFNSGYGDYTVQNPSFFAKGENVVELPYTITPPVQRSGSELIVPRLIAVKNGNVQPFKGKPRVYYYQGVKTGTWDLVDSISLIGTTLTEYPALHHLDDSTNPTFDICLGTPSQVFYQANTYTTVNSFTEYLELFINELTSVDSKMLRAYFHLNEDESNETTLKRLKNIDGVLYRINQIKDFVSGRTTMVELIKVLEVQSRGNYVLGDAVSEKVGQFGTFDPTDTEYNFRTSELSSDVTVSDRFDLYNLDTTLNVLTVTLDDRLIRDNYKFSVRKDKGGNPVNITPANGKRINGFSTYSIATAKESITIKWTGSQYIIISKY